MSTATLLAPTWHSQPDWSYTVGPEVCELGELAHFTADANQAAILDATFAFTKDHRPACFEVGVIGPRQNIKTGTLKLIALGKLFLLRQRLIMWSAHEYTTAQESFRELREMIEGSASLSRQVKRIRESDGREEIELTGDRRLRFRARRPSTGRGLAGDASLLDEAFAVTRRHTGSLLPTMLTRPEAQVFYGSSAGLPESDILRDLRDRGRVGADRLAYFEWGDRRPHEGCETADCDHRRDRPGCALDDRERWWATNPALGLRIDEEAIADLRRSLPPEEFARECLCWWDDPASLGQKITAAQWAAIGDEDAAPSGELYLSADASPGLASASIVAYGGEVLELIERRPGVWWLTDRLVELAERHRPAAVAVDPSGPIGALVPEMQTAGLDLTLLDGKDAARAPVALVRAVTEATFHHRGEADFLTAVQGARWKEIGDGLRLSRRDSTVDITPLVAAAVALWVATEEPDYDLLQSAW